MENVQAANSHTLTPEEGWLRSHPSLELLQVIRMKVLQPTRQETRLQTPVEINKTLLWIQCFWGFFGGELPSLSNLERGWDVTKLPGLPQKTNSKARVKPISWWNTYLQGIRNNLFNSLHCGCPFQVSYIFSGKPIRASPTPLAPKALIQTKFSTAVTPAAQTDTSEGSNHPS